MDHIREKQPIASSILLIRPGALGDSVLTLPALHALRLSGAENLLVLGTTASWGFVRSAHDGLRIRDFSSSEWLGLFANAGGVRLGECAREALARTQAAVVYLTGDTRTAVEALKAHGVKDVLCIEPPRAECGAEIKPHASRQLTAGLRRWVSQELIELAHTTAEMGADSDIFLKLSEDECSRALYGIGLDAAPPRGFIAMHPGSGGRRKCWPAERYARLAVKLACRGGAVPLVFFGPADGAVRDEFESAMPPGIEWQAAGCRPLRDVLALLSISRGYVGNDSGITHLSAHACPTVALFGPSNPHVWAPVGKNVRIVHAPNGELARLSVDEVLTNVEFWVANIE